MNRYVQILTTTATKRHATGMANTLVAKRLAACVQVVGPITSTYRWKGKVETSKEWLLVIKSQRKVYAKVEKEIKRMSRYALPEITVTDIFGSIEYLSWIESNTIK